MRHHEAESIKSPRDDPVRMQMASEAFKSASTKILIGSVFLLLVVVDANLSLTSFQNYDSSAVCVDGSASGYYWKPSSTIVSSRRGNTPSPSNVWIVHLQGGGWCYDEASCKRRCAISTNPLCSSKYWEMSLPLTGTLDDFCAL